MGESSRPSPTSSGRERGHFIVHPWAPPSRAPISSTGSDSVAGECCGSTSDEGSTAGSACSSGLRSESEGEISASGAEADSGAAGSGAASGSLADAGSVVSGGASGVNASATGCGGECGLVRFLAGSGLQGFGIAWMFPQVLRGFRAQEASQPGRTRTDTQDGQSHPGRHRWRPLPAQLLRPALILRRSCAPVS